MEEKLVHEKTLWQTLNFFTEALASDAPAPGGGSAAALCGSLGASLCSMVANLTVGRKKYAEYEPLALQTASEAEELRKAFLTAIDEDTDAFNRFSAVLTLPKETEEEKAFRGEEMRKALYSCMEAPVRVMRLSLKALELTEGLLGKSNLGAVSDIGVAALCLKTATQSAWLNVRINFKSLREDEKALAYREEGEALLNAVCARADACYEQVLSLL